LDKRITGYFLRHNRYFPRNNVIEKEFKIGKKIFIFLDGRYRKEIIRITYFE